jgi:nicotinic acid mononucleotide adenylyltransferase
MAGRQGPHRPLEVRGRQRRQGLRGPEGDVRRSGAEVGGRSPDLAPRGVAPARHAGHRIRVDRAAITAALLRALREGPPRLEVLGDVPAAPGRVALVSGSFDPITAAHAALAEALMGRNSGLVLLVYSPKTMPKEAGAEPPILRPEDRLASVSAWCASKQGFLPAVCSHGLYVEQAEAAARTFPAAEIVLGLGADKVVQLFDPSWYPEGHAALDRLFERALVLYAPREGREGEVERILAGHRRWASRVKPIALPEDLRDVSSSEVRRRIRRGHDVSSLVPPEVLPFLPVPG